jgi:hypothetical protein
VEKRTNGKEKKERAGLFGLLLFPLAVYQLVLSGGYRGGWRGHKPEWALSRLRGDQEEDAVLRDYFRLASVIFI